MYEDINLVELSKQHRNADGNQFKLGKTNYDNGWGMTRDMIKYKMEEEGKYYIEANKRHDDLILYSMLGSSFP